MPAQGSRRCEFRKTRDSVVVKDLAPPYQPQRLLVVAYKLVHPTAMFPGAIEGVTCCRMHLAMDVVHDVHGTMTTCLRCATCRGCPACRAGHVCEATMKMGKWVTKDGRRLYPFEMDETHLRNAIAKLQRDQGAFKKDWEKWLDVLWAESRKRGLE